MTTQLQVGTSVVPDRGTDPRRALAVTGGGMVSVLVLMSLIRLVTGSDNLLGHNLVGAALGMAVPIALAGLGGLWSERAGVVNIGLEGMMVLGTWGAAYFSLTYGPWAGIAGGLVLGLIGGLVHTVATVYFGVDHIISGVAINLIGPGAAKFLAALVWPQYRGVQSERLPTLPSVTIPGLADGLHWVEDQGWFVVSEIAGLLGGLVTDLNALTIVAVLAFAGSWWLLWKTPFGLRLRSCGEAPHAAESLGVNVYRYKAIAVLMSGALAGLGGAYLALVASGQFSDGQTGGRGYIGLAAMIIGNWRPLALFASSLLFGYIDAARLRGSDSTIHSVLLIIGVIVAGYAVTRLARRGQRALGAVALGIGGLLVLWWALSETVPTQFTPYLPHAVTLLVCGLMSQNLRMPAADGVVYRRGEHT